MLKYVKKCQKQSVLLACGAMGLSWPLCLLRQTVTLTQPPIVRPLTPCNMTLGESDAGGQCASQIQNG